MSDETGTKRALDFRRDSAIETPDAELANTLAEYTLEHLKRLVPFLWSTDLMIQKEVNLSIKLYQGSPHETAITADAQLNWKSWIASEDGQTKIMAVLHVEFLDGVHFSFIDK